MLATARINLYCLFSSTFISSTFISSRVVAADSHEASQDEALDSINERWAVVGAISGGKISSLNPTSNLTPKSIGVAVLVHKSSNISYVLRTGNGIPGEAGIFLESVDGRDVFLSNGHKSISLGKFEISKNNDLSAGMLQNDEISDLEVYYRKVEEESEGETFAEFSERTASGWTNDEIPYSVRYKKDYDTYKPISIDDGSIRPEVRKPDPNAENLGESESIGGSTIDIPSNDLQKVTVPPSPWSLSRPQSPRGQIFAREPGLQSESGLSESEESSENTRENIRSEP